MSHDYPAPAIDSLPDSSRLATAYDRVRSLAEVHLDGPVTVEIDAWEDGEYRITAYHSYGPWRPGGDRLKALLRSHSAEHTVRGALFEVDGDTGEESLIFQTVVADHGGHGRAPQKIGTPEGGD